MIPPTQLPVAGTTSAEPEPEPAPVEPGTGGEGPVSMAPSRSSASRQLAQRAINAPAAPKQSPSLGTYSPEIRRKFGLQ